MIKPLRPAYDPLVLFLRRFVTFLSVLAFTVGLVLQFNQFTNCWLFYGASVVFALLALTAPIDEEA